MDNSTWHLLSKNTNGYTKMRLTCLIQQHGTISQPASFRDHDVTKLQRHKEWWSLQYDSTKNDHIKLIWWQTHTHTNTHEHTQNTHTQTHTQLQQYWWQSLKTDITSAQLFAVFDDNLLNRHRFSRTLGDVWWQSFTTAITSVELWAMFDDNLLRQPSIQ